MDDGDGDFDIHVYRCSLHLLLPEFHESYLAPANNVPLTAPNVDKATATGMICLASPKTSSAHVYNCN